MIKKFIYILLIALIYSSLYAKSNEWIQNPYKNYDRNNFLAVVGEGKSKSLAEEDALRNIASFFSVSVKSEVKSQKNYQQKRTNENSIYSEEIKLSNGTIIVVHQDGIIAVEYPESLYDKKNNIWYVLAIMDIKKACGIYIQQIEENQKLVNSLIYNSKNETLYGFKDLRIALKVASENEKLNYRLQLLDSSKNLKITEPSFIKAKIKSLLERNPVYIEITNDDGTITSIFKNILEENFFIITENNAVPNKLKGDVCFQYTKSDDESVIFCEVIINTELAIQNENNILYPLTLNAREGGKTEADAKVRAIKKLKSKIDEYFTNDWN